MKPSTMRTSITQAQVDAQIVDIQVSTVFEKVTVVSVRLANGFVLVESAGAVDKANYSESVGREICLARIKAKIWELEGYRLSSALVQRPVIEGIAEAARALCHQIERCGASEELTKASVLASDLSTAIRAL